MSVLSTGMGVSGGYTVSQSLRFRASNSAYLSRTFVTPTSSSIWTLSAWVKRGAITGTFCLFGAETTTYLTFNSSDQLNLTLNGVSACTSTAVFRDPSAHYHIVYQQNGSAQTIYVNNVSVATGTTAAAIFNTAIAHQLGAANTSNYFDGYMSEINFIDGQALTPSSFGETDAYTGIWVPKKYTGTYGNNGFYLPFNDATSLTTLGYDRSGNGNNWTCNGISITAGATYDVMKDSPTNGLNEVGNYCTLNPLEKATNTTITNANLSASNASATIENTRATSPTANQYSYWEWRADTVGSSLRMEFGGCLASIINTLSRTSYLSFPSVGFGAVWDSGLTVYVNGSSVYTNGSANLVAGDIIGFAHDNVTGKLWLALNGVWYNSGNPAVGTGNVATLSVGAVFPAVMLNGTAGTNAASFNAGQQPFAYTPPTGFKALHTGNLPAGAIRKPSDHFQVKLDTGANIKTTCEAVFTNELEWIKDRANANNHQLIDSVRGSNAVLQSNTTAAETTYSAPSGSSVGWVWRASDSAPVSNTTGSITSSVSANTTAGFSIVTYTGTGVNATVGHGLGVAPKMVIVKQRTAGTTGNWAVYHAGIASDAQTDYLLLNSTAAAADLNTYWNGTAPTSTVFSIGTVADTNESAKDFIAYCFAEVSGYSKFGSYTGNDSADGPFVYCDFRPAFILIKASSTTGSWAVLDSNRDGYNVDNDPLYADTTALEATTDLIDILSNGFKLRSTDAVVNGANTYIFAAFAESPFSSNNRAR